MKKSMILTSHIEIIDYTLHHLQLDKKDVVILQSYHHGVLHPFGNTVRSILLAAYKEQISDFYFVDYIVDKNEHTSYSDIRAWLQQEGVKDETFELLHYLDHPSKHYLEKWLSARNPKVEIQTNLEMLNKHPLLPHKLTFHGLLFSNDHEDFKVERIST
ncbi:hypothetical protein [Bacillus sp. FJAT-45350]|uniref:hypothetical protein n=1 Tax=Bacillus sp. FJAT-45350 TaxID=2011014 RepID=UPI000BB8029A|nr:hypothetical protein [Bacillus sp. FJAT-45350]